MPIINSPLPKPIDIVRDDIEFLKVRIRSLEIEIKNINKNITKMITDNINEEPEDVKSKPKVSDAKSWFW